MSTREDVGLSTLQRGGASATKQTGFFISLDVQECSFCENHSVGNSLPKPFSRASSYTLAAAAEN